MPEAARILNRLLKTCDAMRWPADRKALFQGVAASREHRRQLRKLPKITTAIDVGANHGQWLLELLKWHPETVAHAFEPHPTARTRLEKLFGSHPNIHIYPYALGNTSSVATLHTLPDSSCSSLLLPSDRQLKRTPGWTAAEPTHKETVQAKRFDEVIKEDCLLAPVLCKIDVQGFEFEALAGMGNLINQIDHLVVELSLSCFYQHSSAAGESIAFLQNLGFQLEEIYDMYVLDGRCLQADFYFKR